MAIFAMGVVPTAWFLAAFAFQFSAMQKVDFCLSCHTMDDYGKSLHADSEDSLVAAHYQNNRIPKDTACYVCHADHTPVIGPIKTKIKGLKEAYIEYIAGPPDEMHMKHPYENDNCLHCHEESKSFHEAHEDNLAALESGEERCLDCHDVAHVIEKEAKEAEEKEAEHE